MKYLLFFILFIVAIAYGFLYAKENRLIRLPTPSYISCGCGGCCKGTEPAQQCLYQYNGDKLEDVIKKDKAEQANVDCVDECTPGIEYQYCD